MFNGSSRFSIEGKNTFNHVQRDQINGPITVGIVNLHPAQAVTKPTEYNQFRAVIHGDMIKVKELHSEELSEWDWEWQNGELVGRCKSSAQRTIHIVEIVDRPSKYTAMIYKGKDAQGFWEEDFRQFSRTDNLQLFGINQSEIPVLIFHHELIPCAHFYTGSFWMNVYLEYLRLFQDNMHCSYDMVWMNTTSGLLFCGPRGPDTHVIDSVPESIVVPPTVDMLKDDVSFSYKRTYLDDLFPWMAEDHRSKDAVHLDSHRYLRSLWRNLPGHLPMDVIGGLRFDTVYSPSLEAVARRPQGACSLWDWWRTDGIMDRTEPDGGLTCFTYDPVQRKPVYLEVLCTQWIFWREWFSQCSHVFDALGVTDRMQDFFTVGPPKLILQSTEYFTTSSTLHNAEHTLTPVYLFVHPLPITVPELVSWMELTPYFWSFDKTGRSRMSEEECKWWDLPVLTIIPYLQLYSYPTHVYTALRDWQKARGFDPTTSDWVQSMGYLELEIIDTEDCFVLVKDEDSDWEVLPDT